MKIHNTSFSRVNKENADKFSNMFTMFTDGSALKNSKTSPAGYAVYFPKIKKLFAKGMIGTNNQAELEALRFGLWYFNEHVKNSRVQIPNDTLIVFSDSEYSIRSIEGKYNGNANKEKIEECKRLVSLIKEKYEVEFVHVVAHSGGTDFVSVNNDIVDKAAREEANKCKSKKGG